MKRNKKSLKFNKIKIANINFLKGGSNTGSPASGINVCQSAVDCPPPNEASAIQNPCSDACYVSAVKPYQDSAGIGECYLGYCLH